MKLTEIQELIRFVSRSGVTEVEIEQKDFKITIKTGNEGGKRGKSLEAPVMQQMPGAIPGMALMPQVVAMPQAAPAAQAAPQVATAVNAEENSKYITIKSPMIGTFYRSPSPDKPAFINVGDSVKQGDMVCVIEAMKLFNEIESEISGKVVKVLADDNSPVEYDQPLFLIDPS